MVTDTDALPIQNPYKRAQAIAERFHEEPCSSQAYGAMVCGLGDELAELDTLRAQRAEAQREAELGNHIETWKTNARFDSPDRSIDLYTADQLAAAVAAERERCLRIVESADNYSNPMTANDCAAAIRAGAKERDE